MNLNFATKIVIVLTCLFVTPCLSQEAQEITLQSNLGQVDLFPNLLLFEDTSASLSIKQVHNHHQHEFIKPLKQSLGYSSSAYWAKLTLRNNSDIKEWWWQFPYPLLDEVSLFKPTGSGSYQEFKSGDWMPFNQRAFKHRTFVFPIYPDSTTETYYFRIKTGSTVTISANLWQPKPFLQADSEYQIGYGIYYGIMIVMMLYNLFVFLSLRDISYLYYIGSIASVTMLQMGLNGVGYQYLWSNAIWWNDHEIAIMAGATGLALSLFARSFLNTHKFSTRFNGYFKIMAALGCLGLMLAIIIPYQKAIIINMLYLLILFISLVWAGIVMAYRGYKPARFFLIAWVAFILGAVLTILRGLGVLPSNFITLYSVQIGSALEVVLISFALADRINTYKEKITQKEKEKQVILKGQKELLEQQVLERTEALQLKSTELEKSNKEIKDSIKYAQRIQLALLPHQDFLINQLPKHFIFYRPRDIVSGDFYWVGESSGYLYLAVVDCTGHGVPGAFMSVLGMNLLKESMSSLNGQTPAAILEWMNLEVVDALKQKAGDSNSKEGMDMSLIRIDPKNHQLIYSGAKRPLYIIDKQQLKMIKGEPFSVGFNHHKRGKANYIDHEISIHKAMTIYMSSDGFADQLGMGDDRSSKFMHKKFRVLLQSISKLDINQQKKELETRFDAWKANRRQTDDVLVMGIEF